MTSRQKATVRISDFRALMQKSGLSYRRLGAEIGMSSQAIDRMVRGLSAVSPRFVRDVPLVLASALGEDPSFIRSVLFTEGSEDPEPQSVLQRRVAARPSLLALDEREDTHA